MITVMLVLRSGRNFSENDVSLLSRHIHKTSDAQIFCLSDTRLNIKGVEYISMQNPWKKMVV